MITSEDDVRSWVRSASGGKARWVEPALGSTPGLPDCWVPWDGEAPRDGVKQCVHLELKLGKIKGGQLSFTVRPEQRREIKAMLGDNVPVGFLIGVEGGSTMVFASADSETLRGMLRFGRDGSAYCLVELGEFSDRGFWHGVNFIFLDFVEFVVARGAENGLKTTGIGVGTTGG